MKKPLVFAFLFSLPHFVHALPATGLVCSSYDGDFKLEAVINHYTGDLYANTLKIYEKGTQRVPEVKQYRNYSDDIFIIASLGREGTSDDVGYVISLERAYRDPTEASGNAEKYTTTMTGDRETDSNTYMSVDCKIGTP
ncbi:hypothetical protein [Bdellovibrio sp. HCB337]|uniref:hypothetical protein n=1 Tax=Bdellovibrio sp. HCB337 TaxID=3394358 RepID=UPI0039A658B3